MNRVCSILSQLLQLFLHIEFERAVKEHQAERHARGSTSWGQFVAMLFCQLGRAHSLREICGGFGTGPGVGWRAWTAEMTAVSHHQEAGGLPAADFDSTHLPT